MKQETFEEAYKLQCEIERLKKLSNDAKLAVKEFSKRDIAKVIIDTASLDVVFHSRRFTEEGYPKEMPEIFKSEMEMFLERMQVKIDSLLRKKEHAFENLKDE